MSDPWTWHGGGLEAAKRRFGGGDWIDLSTGINPQPWPGAAGMAFDWRRLPDPENLARLERVAAGYFGVDPRHVCAVPGSGRSEEHTSELQSLMRISYAVLCLQTKSTLPL